MQGDELAVLSALTVGDKEELSEHIIETYSVAGASHVLALSGLHIGFISALLLFFLSPLWNRWRGLKPLLLLMVIVFLWGFAFLTGLSPSVIRAVIMCSFWLLSTLFSACGKMALNTLGATAFLMLLLKPVWLFDVGFQLSFSAVAAILLLQPGLYGLVSVKNTVLRKIWGLATVSVAAQVGTAPLRTEHELSNNLRKKVALFCNVDENAVVQSIDAPTIYEVPILMQSQGLDATILKKMGLPVGDTPGLGPWRAFLERRHKAEETAPLHIALVGKYDLQDAYKSIREALSQAGTYNDRKVSVDFVNSEKLTDENVAEALKGMAGVLIGPGFGERGVAGKFVAIKYARTHNIPTFGICLGMQCIAIEFARNVLGYADANSREMDEKTPHNVIDIMEEQKSITNMGGTMRLGAYECVLLKDSKAYEAYGTEHIQERHRHRYEFNNSFKEAYEAAGMKCVGINPESDLVEIVEIPALKWFVGTQFHPEYSSTVLHPHPLFVAFVKAAIENENEKK